MLIAYGKYEDDININIMPAWFSMLLEFTTSFYQFIVYSYKNEIKHVPMSPSVSDIKV